MGIPFSVADFYHNILAPGKPAWNVDECPDLTGKVALVTGGNTGIGKETVKVLLAHNARVYMAARDKAKAEAAIQELKSQTGKEAAFLALDLASLKAVKESVAEFQKKEKELHLLFNNGGVMAPPKAHLTTDGYDLQFGTNVIGHYLLTKLLLPTLLAGAQSPNNPDKKVRVISTSSFAHMASPKFDFGAIKEGPGRKKYSTFDLYGLSKLGNVLFANELARRYGDQGIVSTSVHPGTIKTELGRHIGIAGRIWYALNGYTVDFGVIPQLRAGTDPEALKWNGEYIIPWGRLYPARADAKDPALAKKLWEYMEEETKDV